MKKLLLIFLWLYLFSATDGLAFWPKLDKDQTTQAIEYGKELSHNLGPDSEWSVRSDQAAGWIELTTPFNAVAKLSRDFSLKSKTINERDIKRAAAPYKGKLVFNYFHYNIEKRFTGNATSEYFATIRTANNRIIYPLRYEKGTEAFTRISLEFSFSSAKIDPDSVIYLLIREPSGYEHEFMLDLSKIR